MIERSGRFGTGVAYSTDHPLHLLNTRTGDMSAWPDRPGHFTDRLSGKVEAVPDFALRRLYGDYLGGLFLDAQASDRLVPIADEVVDVDEDDATVRLELRHSGILERLP